nr:uncharacterized protein LOC108394475 [Manis javanica]
MSVAEQGLGAGWSCQVDLGAVLSQIVEKEATRVRKVFIAGLSWDPSKRGPKTSLPNLETLLIILQRGIPTLEDQEDPGSSSLRCSQGRKGKILDQKHEPQKVHSHEEGSLATKKIGEYFGEFPNDSGGSSKYAEALNEISDFREVEGDNLFRHVPLRWTSLLPAIEKMLKCWPPIKPYFQNVGQEECPSLTWKYIEDENGEKDYSKTEMYMLFLQNCLMIFEEAIKCLKKDELTAPELLDVMYRLRERLIQQKKESFFWK